jgi:hypothetical protein
MAGSDCIGRCLSRAERRDAVCRFRGQVVIGNGWLSAERLGGARVARAAGRQCARILANPAPQPNSLELRSFLFATSDDRSPPASLDERQDVPTISFPAGRERQAAHTSPGTRRSPAG